MAELTGRALYSETRERFHCGARATDAIPDGALVNVYETYNEEGVFTGYRVRLVTPDTEQRGTVDG